MTLVECLQRMHVPQSAMDRSLLGISMDKIQNEIICQTKVSWSDQSSGHSLKQQIEVAVG